MFCCLHVAGNNNSKVLLSRHCIKLTPFHAVVILNIPTADVHSLALCDIKLYLPFVSPVTTPVQVLLQLSSIDCVGYFNKYIGVVSKLQYCTHDRVFEVVDKDQKQL